jgi:hypothetical protein
MWSGALFGQDGDGGHGHEGLEPERPQPGQDGAEASGLGNGVEDVEAEGGAVGEHGEGAKPARVVDGTVDAVAVLCSTSGHGASPCGCLGRMGHVLPASSVWLAGGLSSGDPDLVRSGYRVRVEEAS